jgi:hypothetical protein
MATGDLCSLPDVKALLNLTAATDDALLARMITSASKYFEKQTGRVFSTTSYTEVFGGSDDRIRQRAAINLWSPTVQLLGQRGYAVNLRNWPITAITQVMIDGVVVPARPALVAGDTNNALSTDGYVLVDKNRLELQGSYQFTPGISNIQVDYSTGWPDEDLAVVGEAVINLVAWRYKGKDRIGQLSKTIGGETVSFSREAIDPYTQQIIDLYQTVRV